MNTFNWTGVWISYLADLGGSASLAKPNVCLLVYQGFNDNSPSPPRVSQRQHTTLQRSVPNSGLSYLIRFLDVATSKVISGQVETCVCLLLCDATAILFQWYHGGDMMYEMRRRTPEPTLLLTMATLTSQTILGWYEKNRPLMTL